MIISSGERSQGVGLDMFTVNINFSLFRGSILMRFESLEPPRSISHLIIFYICCKMKILRPVGWNHNDVYAINCQSIYAIFWSVRKKMKSFEASRSLPASY